MLICICLLACFRARAQDQMPIVELQRFMSGKVWVIEQECVHDSCYTPADDGYYWSEDVFDSYRTFGPRSWCFTLRHAFYFKEQPAANAELIINRQSPDICVLSVNSVSNAYTVHYASATGSYEMKLTVIDERSFMLLGSSWGSRRTCYQFHLIDPSPELSTLIAKNAGNE